MSGTPSPRFDLPAWCLVGVVLGLAVGASPASPERVSTSADARTRDPDELALRELRALPGIGPARALAIVRARWDGLRGGPAAWRDVPGIGEATANAAEDALSRTLVEPFVERAYTRGESP